MATEVRGGMIEALVSAPVSGIGVTGVMLEALVSSPLTGIGITGAMIEALVAPIPAVETGLQGATIIDRPFQGTLFSGPNRFKE